MKATGNRNAINRALGPLLWERPSHFSLTEFPYLNKLRNMKMGKLKSYPDML
jgi:hypothetical protein